jgi:RNA polymerase sigma-70 factor (ECF subfamily)
VSSNTSVTTSVTSRLLSQLALCAGLEIEAPVASDTLSDEALFARVARGDQEALEQFINRHARAVYSCIRHRVRLPETADDLFQETWIRVMERCDTFRLGSAVLPWLYRIAINVVNDYGRRSQAVRRGGAANHVSLDEAEGTAAVAEAGVDEVLIQDQQKAALHKAVMELPEPFGEIVRLRYFEELPVADVAVVVGCAEGTVKSRLSRGLTLLQKLLEAQS